MTQIIYPDSFYALQEQSERPIHFVIPPSALNIKDCRNCGGIGSMYYRENKSGPFSTPDGKNLYYREGEGWYRGQIIPEPCPVCAGDQKAAFLRNISGLEGKDLEIRLDDFQPLQGKEKAREFGVMILRMVPNPVGLYTFWGDFGVGKTTLLKALTNGFRVAAIPAIYRRMSDILSEVKETYSDNSKLAAQEVIRKYKDYSVMLIDEVDRVYKTEWALDVVFTLLDDRYSRLSTSLTVIATNQSPEELGDDFPYLASRIKEGLVIEVAGADIRPAKGLQKERDMSWTDT